MDQKRKMKRKYIRLKTTLVFIFIFLAVWCVIWIINQSQERREKLKATYTAESTVSRVESQLSKYLAESDLMKQIVEKEYDIDNEQFDKLAELMQEDEDVIEPGNWQRMELYREFIRWREMKQPWVLIRFRILREKRKRDLQG